MPSKRLQTQSAPHEGYIPVENVSLYYREIGHGAPLVVLHGGPDFSHSYLLPDLDSLSDAFHLIYFDQRGRGRSAANVRPQDVSMQSEMADLEGVREFFQLGTFALLGHSWGAVLAMEYAIRHPGRVSHLVLMNAAPACREDYMLLRAALSRRAAADIEQMNALSSRAQQRGWDLDTDADYYRAHFRSTLRSPVHLERLIQNLRRDFTSEGIEEARQIEDRLMDQTWLSTEYNLLPRLGELKVPTLILHGERDLVPLECATHLAAAIPGAHLVVLEGIGHFSYVEAPAAVHKAITALFDQN